MDHLEKTILKKLQSEFTLSAKPFREMAEQLGISEERLIKTAEKLKKDGVIRRIGAVISPRHLKYRSALLAAKVPEKNLNKFSSLISSSENVSHNYLRQGDYNVWFTYSARTKRQIGLFVNGLKKKRLAKHILILPAVKTYKIRAEFKF